MGAKKETIVWALDPAFSELPMAKSRHLLNVLGHLAPLQVDPVSVVAAEERELDPSWAQKVLRLAKRPIQKMRGSGQRGNYFDGSRGREEIVRMLADYAHAQNAKIIFVNMHSRRGFGRFRMGSFTEQLIAHSTVPVLAIRPDTRVPQKIARIFFPSELTVASSRVYSRLLELAKEWNSSIVISHRLELPRIFSADWVGFAAATEIEAMHQAMRETEGLKTKIGIAWARRAEQQGVKAEFQLMRSMNPLGQAIVKSAQEAKADLIALTAQSHSLAETILGNSAKKILRHSARPVLVFQGREVMPS